MSPATRCTCLWRPDPFTRVVADPECPARPLHNLLNAIREEAA